MGRTWTDEQLIAVIGECRSLDETAERLGLVRRSGGSKTVKKAIVRLGLDTSHFNQSRRGGIGDGQLRATVAASSNLSDLMRRLSLPVSGVRRKSIRSRIEALGLPIGHWDQRGGGQNWRPIEDYIERGVPVSGKHLKKRLFKEGLKEEVCEACGIAEWMDKPLVLHLEHRNGHHNDNSWANLEILCPNCHSQTPTYARTNI